MNFITFIKTLPHKQYLLSVFVVSCHVGDWVEVICDYSHGVCSEGGTGVVIAKNEGTYHLYHPL
jgi:hypothetical protein